MNSTEFNFAHGQGHWVKLENGKVKIFYSFWDANSWAKSLRSPIVDVSKVIVKAPEIYNPSNKSVIESHILAAGSIYDFTDDFLAEANK